ncbi:hypothetical protein A2U01_0066806, partial [Trifolium medium]|nr:hypothetical protein [Trifolium medium]
FQDGESNTVVDGITIDLKTRWKIIECALKSRYQEVIENPGEPTGVGAQRSKGWRGARYVPAASGSFCWLRLAHERWRAARA